MLHYRWPGNVRELRNAIERAILLCDGGLITHEHLPVPPPDVELVRAGIGAMYNGNDRSSNGLPTRALHDGAVAAAAETVNLDVMERGLIERALSQSKGNKSKAARLLGLSRAQLYGRIEKHGIGD